MPAPLIIAGAIAASAAISAILQWKGMKAQATENAKINQLQIGESEKDRKISRETLAANERASIRSEKYNRERDAATAKTNIALNFQSMLNRNPQMVGRLLELQQARRA